jgi:hypothetical protein
VESGRLQVLEWFTKKTPRMGNPVMSFSKIGQIHFNQSAARIMQKEPIEFVLIGWDSSENKMVLKAISNRKDLRAYRIRYNEKGNGAVFSAKTFLDHVGIDYAERRPLPIEIKTDAENFLEVKIPETFFKRTDQQTLPRVPLGKAG